MCGIVAYMGERQAYPILIKGLHRLEYRGYDSAGVALIEKGNDIRLFKCKGKVSELEAHVVGKDISGTVGVGHTRWATHGVPDDKNAHPHFSESGKLVIIHNGIIENCQRNWLIRSKVPWMKCVKPIYYCTLLIFRIPILKNILPLSIKPC